MEPGLYTSPLLPIHWIYIDENGIQWLVPAFHHGWRGRTILKGIIHLERVSETVAKFTRKNLGIEQ